MAGDKLIRCLTPNGLPTYRAIINGNVEPDDEWALFRLTDDGLAMYKEGYEFRSGIMGLYINNERAVKEIARLKTEDEARQVKRQDTG